MKEKICEYILDNLKDYNILFLLNNYDFGEPTVYHSNINNEYEINWEVNENIFRIVIDDTENLIFVIIKYNLLEGINEIMKLYNNLQNSNIKYLNNGPSLIRFSCNKNSVDDILEFIKIILAQ